MKERPILMSAPMVRAVLAGHKTQTRRIMKPQPHGILHGHPVKDDDGTEMLCPYGRPGDRLWVRERFGYCSTHNETSLHYYADLAKDSRAQARVTKWKPSIHMPKELARIFLEIGATWAERLQDISKSDCEEEGCYYGDFGRFDLAPLPAYQLIWENINGKGSWAKNPWVWVVVFKRVEANG